MTQAQYKNLPKLVQQMCELFDCMIVGSTADKGINSDIDMIVPFEKWQGCASFIVNNARIFELAPTRFGGWGFQDVASHRQVDVWPMRMEDMFVTCRPSSVYWPKYHLNVTPTYEG